MIAQALALFVGSFILVFLLCMQQLNVTASRYWLAFFTAMAICGAQLVQFKILPGPTGLLLVGALMLGSALGVVASMRAHPWLLRVLEPGAAWPLVFKRWLGSTPAALAAERARQRDELGREIAREAARSDIERYSAKLWHNGGTWFDTTCVTVDANENPPHFEARVVNRAMRYLDGTDLLIRHAVAPNLVRFKP